MPRELDLGAKRFLFFAQLSSFKIDLRMTHGNRGWENTTTWVGMLVPDAYMKFLLWWERSQNCQGKMWQSGGLGGKDSYFGGERRRPVSKLKGRQKDGRSSMLSLKPSRGVARCGSKTLSSSYSLEGAPSPCQIKDASIPARVAPVWLLKLWSICRSGKVISNPQWLLERSPPVLHPLCYLHPSLL